MTKIWLSIRPLLSRRWRFWAAIAVLVVAGLTMCVPSQVVNNALNSQGASAQRGTPSPAASPIASETEFVALFTPAPIRLYWGALVDGQAPTSAELGPGGVFGEFESRAGKKMAILHWVQPWRMGGNYQAFQTVHFDNVRSHGSIPLLDWGSYNLSSGPSQPDFQLSAITAGLHDNYIRQWAQDAKAWGHPFFLRFDWEMNGNWQFPWSAQLNGNTAQDYIRAWRRVHDLFAQVGATNVTWVWCPNISSDTTLPYASLYPGNDYVDWTCFDGYNFYETWLSFNSVFTGSGVNWLNNSYQEMLSVAPAKPIMIGATATVEAGDGGAAKAAWIVDAFGEQLPNYLPRIKAVVWFNWAGYDPLHPTMPIESSPASIAAFASAIGSNNYVANEFGNLNTSPIPPP